MTKRSEVIVVGGGLAGAAAAASLARSGLDTLHLAPPAPLDRRTSALMMPSVDFLISQGLIDVPAEIGHALTSIRIIDATNRLIRAPEAVFDAAEIGLEAFGWNFGNAKLLERFKAASPSHGLTVIDGIATAHRRTDGMSILTLSSGEELEAPLVVGADGKKSMLRGAAGIGTHEHKFDEVALVCDLELSRPIGGTSIEFHYPKGPFTLVPAGGNRANLVWIDDEATLRGVHAAGADALVDAINAKSQRLFGKITLASPSAVFPLSSLNVDVAGNDGIVLIGEAAHAFPPIGAQGLNLSLRDVADVVAAIQSTDKSVPDWGATVSDAYAKLRSGDLVRTGRFVDTLFRSLLADMLPSQTLRAGGLWALKLVPPLRRQAFTIGMGER